VSDSGFRVENIVSLGPGEKHESARVLGGSTVRCLLLEGYGVGNGHVRSNRLHKLMKFKILHHNLGVCSADTA